MSRPLPRRRTLWALPITAALAPVLAFAQAPQVQPAPDPFGAPLRPVAITSVAGDVTNPSALITGHGETTLTMTPGGTAPQIILDYGRDVGGLPGLDVTAASGAPMLSEIFSESLQGLFPAGDGAPGFAGAPGDPSRVDRFAIDHPGLIANTQIQGGERFEAITLTSPGQLVLSAAFIKSLTADPKPSTNTGHFASSDPLLDQIWNLGARSLQLAEVPAGSLPPLLSVTKEGLLADAAPPAVYQYGGAWTDYTASVDVKLLHNEATFLLRPGTLHTLNLTLHADNDRFGTPNVIDAWDSGVFGDRDLKSLPLPLDLKPGAWHRLSVQLHGGSVSVSIDGQPIGNFQTPTTAGSVGFRSPNYGSALFRDLTVVDTSGNTLFHSALHGPNLLKDFAAGTNQLPVILDGGKRDRLVWLGDLGISDATVFYTSAEDQYVAGSLSLLGSFQKPDGEISTNTTPLIDPQLGSGPLPFAAGFYSLPYSIYYVNAAAEYVLYSGDHDFLIRTWPAIKREMTYLTAHTGADHLIHTTPDNGMDWALDIQTGAATEYNALYVRALRNAAAMANQMHDPAYAAQMESQAATVTQAINANLFNPTTGVYDASTDHRGTYAQDANVLAALYNIPPAADAAPDAASVLAKTAAKLETPHGPLAFSDGTGLSAVISPFMSGFEVEARFEHNDDTGALALIRKLWGPMAQPSDHDTGGAYEALGPNGQSQMPTRTLAHGWSSAPTAALSEYVLGVTPTQPGFAQWQIRPQTGDLTWARGTVPTPKGPIQVAWKRDPQAFTMTVTVPAHTSGTIELPTPAARHLSVNGINQPIPPARDGYLILQNVQPGTYHLAATE